jgi:hypothetical protein
MKKMFFTAIAVVAFSGASIANTVEVKKEVVMFNCVGAALDYYEAVMDQNGGGDDWGFLNSLLSRCK